jgi:hypothetical protein
MMKAITQKIETQIKHSGISYGLPVQRTPQFSLGLRFLYFEGRQA